MRAGGNVRGGTGGWEKGRALVHVLLKWHVRLDARPGRVSVGGGASGGRGTGTERALLDLVGRLRLMTESNMHKG